MRRVILQEFVTLDGHAADAQGGVDFVPASTQGDESFGKRQLALMDSIDTILLGRVTYEMFAGYWPNVTEGEDAQIAEKINSLPKVVFSRTLDRAPWGKWEPARIVRQPAEKEVPALKKQNGKDMIVWGSISIAQSLMTERLIDEYRIVVCPLVLGSGKPLFGGHVPPLEVKLEEAKPMELGTVELRYTAEG